MTRWHIPKGRILIYGTILLILLIVGFIVLGHIINGIAVQMNGSIVTRVSEYHVRILEVEIRRSEHSLAVAADYLMSHPDATKLELQTLAATLMQTDPKISRIRLGTPDGTQQHYVATPTDSTTTDERWITALQHDTLCSYLVTNPHPIWCMARRITDQRGRIRLCSIELPLSQIYTSLVEQNPYSRSYAILYDPDGIIVYHPDSLMLGHPATDSTGLSAIGQVRRSGERTVTHAVSQYLHIEEARVYHPIEIAGQRWVAGIGIPDPVYKQEISDFHFYTLLTAICSVVIFGLLLLLAQQRWRREYRLRLRSESESEQLHLQQVLEQIDPHFLFNSLNSLYALIRCNPEQAREFTLTLSHVYRHVLERRHEILASVNDEVDFTWQYYSLQKIRFGDRIELITSISPALGNRRIPAMSLQTLVENAVKHNRITAQNPLRIRIATLGEELIIENNYTPRNDEDTASLGVGLERIRSVYRFYTSENLTISTENETFRCRLPLLPADK